MDTQIPNEITLTQFELQSIYRIPVASNDPLPKVTRRPVEIDETGTVLVIDFAAMTVIEIEYLPVVEKAA